MLDRQQQARVKKGDRSRKKKNDLNKLIANIDKSKVALDAEYDAGSLCDKDRQYFEDVEKLLCFHNPSRRRRVDKAVDVSGLGAN